MRIVTRAGRAVGGRGGRDKREGGRLVSGPLPGGLSRAFAGCQPMNSLRSFSMAPLGFAPTMVFTTSPFW